MVVTTKLQSMVVVLAGVLAGGGAHAEDDACGQRATDKGLIGKDRAEFVEACERGGREYPNAQPGVTQGRERPDRSEREASRERSGRDRGPAPVLSQ